jgi:cyclopropane-fatty-acyl-phospholipid synthase
MQKDLLMAVFRSMRGVPFAVTYWDGKTELFGCSSEGETLFRIIFKEQPNIRDMFSTPETSFGEAYLDQTIDVEGNFKALLNLLISNEELFRSDSSGQNLFQRLIKSRRAEWDDAPPEIAGHDYHPESEFYKLWLDKSMAFSCAYFKTPEDTLEAAQQQKIDHILRKLQLKEGETLLDIGSGWGYLVIEAAKTYGVKALGITLSEQQEQDTRRRIEEEGLSGKVEVRVADYRDLAVEGLVFDKIVSVGMFKYVGRENIEWYFNCLKKMLRSGGLSLMHTINRPREGALSPWLKRHVIPWGYVPSLREIIWSLPEHSFHLIDAESLRLHYAMTTACWADNFERVADQIREKYGERFVRMWRLYLVGCSASFISSGLDVHQLLFSHGLCDDLPLTRDYLYRQ